MERCIGHFPSSLIDKSKRARDYFQRCHDTLYCKVLYCTMLRCTVLYCTVLLYYAVRYYAAPEVYCTVARYIVPRCIALHCTVPHCTEVCSLYPSPHPSYHHLHTPTDISTPLRNGRVRLDSLSSDSRDHVANALTIRVRTMPAVRTCVTLLVMCTLSGQVYLFLQCTFRFSLTSLYLKSVILIPCSPLLAVIM